MNSTDIILLICLLIPLCLIRDDPIPENTSILTGHNYFKEIYNHSNPNRFLDVTRFPNKELFDKFLDILKANGLDDGVFITSAQKLMMFIHALKGGKYREIKDRWQHSTSSIKNIIYEVATAVLKAEILLVLRPTGEHIAEKIRLNPKFYPYFKNCLGALDGTHIPAVVLPEDKDSFRGRKGIINSINSTYNYY
jgi:hypothetical protein